LESSTELFLQHLHTSFIVINTYFFQKDPSIWFETNRLHLDWDFGCSSIGANKGCETAGELSSANEDIQDKIRGLPLFFFSLCEWVLEPEMGP
jgi:hypothetical protein